ncbi:hypothetical protein [Enterobacter sp. 22466]|uniref:hypothetical protein n=1 Tax=Enterobacter sp. 22466 TaxID=3453924 RepID=UPI003F848DDA
MLSGISRAVSVQSNQKLYSALGQAMGELRNTIERVESNTNAPLRMAFSSLERYHQSVESCRDRNERFNNLRHRVVSMINDRMKEVRNHNAHPAVTHSRFLSLAQDVHGALNRNEPPDKDKLRDLRAACGILGESLPKLRSGLDPLSDDIREILRVLPAVENTRCQLMSDAIQPVRMRLSDPQYEESQYKEAALAFCDQVYSTLGLMRG